MNSRQITQTTSPAVPRNSAFSKSHINSMTTMAIAPMMCEPINDHFLVNFLVSHGQSTEAIRPPGTTSIVSRLYAPSSPRAYLQKYRPPVYV